MTKADNMTGIWMHFMHLSFLLEMSNATVSKSLISTGHLQMMKEQNVLLLHLWTSTCFYSIHPQPSCWMRHLLTPHWSLCSNTAPELNRHPLKHCISTRGQEHTHTRTHTEFRFNWSLMWNQCYGGVSVFCSCWKKKTYNIHSLQLVISRKSDEASLSGNHRHMTTWIISHSSHPGCFWTLCYSSEIFPSSVTCCMALRCTPKINQAMCDTKAFTFFPSRGTHSINLYPFFF